MNTENPSEVKHAAGPWHVGLEQSFAIGGDTVSVEALTPDRKMVVREVCNLMLDTDSHPDGDEWMEDAANARLIAAAPDLLAACKAWVQYFETMIGDEPSSELLAMYQRSVASHVEATRAAIALAEKNNE